MGKNMSKTSTHTSTEDKQTSSVPSVPNKMGSTQLATFAAGCFWGVQKFFKKQFGSALIKTTVGYTGGSTKTTDYKKVCTGSTGHAEALEIEFDPTKVTYEDLVTYFFRIHDPTTLNRQANDTGSQYRSAIFYHSDEQKKTADLVKEKVKEHFKNPIVTEITAACPFISAEDYHQNYLDVNPNGYCSHKLQW